MHFRPARPNRNSRRSCRAARYRTLSYAILLPELCSSGDSCHTEPRIALIFRLGIFEQLRLFVSHGFQRIDASGPPGWNI